MMQAQKEKQQAAGLVKQFLPVNFTLGDLHHIWSKFNDYRKRNCSLLCYVK